MGFKINYQGIEITASSVAEAVALAQQLAAANGAARLGRPPRDSVDLFEGTSAKDESTAYALAFLMAISRAGANGVGSEEMMRVLKTEHAKGIGGRLVRIHNALRKLKLDPEEIYTAKDVDDERTWFAGPALDEAIQALKK